MHSHALVLILSPGEMQSPLTLLSPPFFFYFLAERCIFGSNLFLLISLGSEREGWEKGSGIGGIALLLNAREAAAAACGGLEGSFFFFGFKGATDEQYTKIYI